MPSPLPLDKLIALNEIQIEMGLGLESKTGALRKLGEAYPAEKLQELINELHQDMLEQGALDLLRTQLTVLIGMLTGVPPEGTEDQDASGVQSAGGPGVTTAAAGAAGPGMPQPPVLDSPEVKDLYNQLTTLSQGTKIPQIRNPAKEE